MGSRVTPRKSPLRQRGHSARQLPHWCGDARRGLGWQIKLQLPHQELLLGVQFGVAGQDQSAAVGGWEVDVEHLDGGELVEHGSRREAGGQRLKLGAQRDVKAIGQCAND